MSPSRHAGLLSLAILLAGCREPNAPLPSEPAQVTGTSVQSASGATVVKGSSDVLQGIDIATAVDDTYCNIESAGGNAFSATALSLQIGQEIRGWLGHSSPGTVDTPTLLFRDASGVPVAGVPLQASLSRDDVAQAYGRAELRNTGFEVVAPLLPPGSYKLLLHYHFNGKPYRCDNGREVIVG